MICSMQFLLWSNMANATSNLFERYCNLYFRYNHTSIIFFWGLNQDEGFLAVHTHKRCGFWHDDWSVVVGVWELAIPSKLGVNSSEQGCWSFYLKLLQITHDTKQINSCILGKNDGYQNNIDVKVWDVQRNTTLKYLLAQLQTWGYLRYDQVWIDLWSKQVWPKQLGKRSWGTTPELTLTWQLLAVRWPLFGDLSLSWGNFACPLAPDSCILSTSRSHVSIFVSVSISRTTFSLYSGIL